MKGMRSKEKKNSFTKRLGFVLLVVWVVGLIGVTAGSLIYEKNTIPRVKTGYPGSGTVSYSCRLEATVTGEDEAEMLIPYNLYLPPQMFAEGVELSIGTVTSCEQGSNEYIVKIQLADSGAEGEMLPVELNYAGEYAQVVDSQYVHLDDSWQPCVYTITEEDGAWGKEYKLKEVNTLCFPFDVSTDKVAILMELDEPIVLESDRELGSGMKVELVNE